MAAALVDSRILSISANCGVYVLDLRGECRGGADTCCFRRYMVASDDDFSLSILLLLLHRGSAKLGEIASSTLDIITVLLLLLLRRAAHTLLLRWWVLCIDDLDMENSSWFSLSSKKRARAYVKPESLRLLSPQIPMPYRLYEKTGRRLR